MPKTKLETRRDSLDFRDRIYQPALVRLDDEKLPSKKLLNIRDQGEEGACTGFGLAAVIDHLNLGRGIREPVSSRMLYEMARRHDQWPGHEYEGSTARGAMKGWHKNGVCAEDLWEYELENRGHLSKVRRKDALRYPLGSYYRVLPKRSDMHAALMEVGAIFATASTHGGWDKVDEDGRIPFKKTWVEQGGHAFAIVGYTQEGFLIQNSWGEDWGGYKHGRRRYPGLALWTYEDFDRNLWDAWVGRMALPVESLAALSTGRFTERASGMQTAQKAPPQHVISEHYVHIDDGGFDPHGDFPSDEDEMSEIIADALDPDGAALPKQIVLYAHGGLNSVKGSAARVAAWREVFEANRVRELHFIWETGLLAELRDIMLGKQDHARERAGGFSDWWDKIIERTTRPLGGALWKEMRSDAEIAFEEGRAGTRVLEMLGEALAALPANRRPGLHLVGHSAGSILFAHLLSRWGALREAHPEWELPAFDNLILFAPACTADLFNARIAPAMRAGLVDELHHFHLDDGTERDDHVGHVYRKSLLYLVSRSFQKKGEIVPLMGMQKHIEKLDTSGIAARRVKHYNTKDDTVLTASDSHGGFDNDHATMNAMLCRVLGKNPLKRRDKPFSELRHPFKEEHLTGF